MDYRSFNKLLGNIDLYLLDHILKGRFEKSDKILDAGCGEGRNLIYFLRTGCEVYGVDKNPLAIEMLRMVSDSIAKPYDKDRFIVAGIEDMPFTEPYFDVVLCSAVLHFARDEQHFDLMCKALTRPLKKGGLLFVRMASDIGIKRHVVPTGDGQHKLPDGSTRYLLTREKIDEWQQVHNMTLLEPVKTVNVEDKRCMTNLLMQKK